MKNTSKRTVSSLVLVLSLSFMNLGLLSGCNEEEIRAACKVGDPSELTQNPPEVPADNTPRTVKVEPNFLREQMYKGNTSVLIAINRAHQARDQVNIARASLLPSINLGSMILTGSNPAFILSSVDTLLPFLIPSKWFDYKKSKNLMRAENEALRLAKLNTYASMYSLYYTVMNDLELRRTMLDDVTDLEQIEEYVKAWYETGGATEKDYLQVHAQVQMARLNLSKMNDLLTKELASLKHGLGLAHSVTLDLVAAPLASSDWEKASMSQALATALDKSPERQQIGYLIQAAKNDVWSKMFGFFTGASLRAAASPGGNLLEEGLSLSQMSKGLSFNIGFTYLPLLQLSQHNLEQLKLRENEIPLELSETLEVALAQLAEAQSRRAVALDAEASFRSVMEREMAEYQTGGGTLRTVLEAKRQLRQASVESLRALTAETLLRLSFHRIFLTDQFDVIDGCRDPKNGQSFL